MDALIEVDVQNDFCPGGALAIEDGDEVVERLNAMAQQYDLVIATRDWHPPDHGSFAQQGGRWPVHCVQGTAGAELHPDLDRDRIDAVVDKGQNPVTEGYSGFEGTRLAELLRERGADRIHVGGLALDYCVKNTALDARREGLEVVVHLDATRAVNAEEGDDERAIAELREAGVEVEA